MTIAVPVDFADDTLAAEVAEDLAVVEASLRDDSALGGDEMFAEISRHMMAAGGKRFRAMLVLLAARFGDSRDKRVIPAAVAIELTHLASLFHDDVMDEAVIRRGHPSANARYGNSVAILAGDYLFARASRILSDLGAEAIRIQAETFGRLCDGQLAETIGPRPGEDTLDHYMRVIDGKTGSLIATSGRFGAMFSGAPEDVIDLVADASMRIGIAWQLSDDVLDIASTSAESGKEQGIDLRQGVHSLPVLYALRGTAPENARLRELLSGADLSDPRLQAEALSLLRSSPALDEARSTVREWASGARDLVGRLPEVPARGAFESLCDFVITRTA
ncbi:MAG TPA: polyprenyl synthetase family protein [Trebonia sp.]